MNKRDIEFSMIAAVEMNRVYPIRVPAKPEWFTCEEKDMEFTEPNVKKIAKEYNLGYTLDYINATVVFISKD
jgi:hypothetical protein